MGALVDRVIDTLEERRERLTNGQINCIPSPFKRFSDNFVGIEQGKYYLVSGSTKSAKTQIMNFIFLYNSVFYAYSHQDKVRLRILYYPLEETQEAITTRFMCYLLYALSHGRIRRSPTELRSTKEEFPIEPEVLELLRSEQYQNILNFYEEHVTFLPDRNPTGILYSAKKYAENNGTEHKKSVTITDRHGEVVDERDVFDYYEPADPNEYVMIIVDHISLIDCEQGKTLRECMNMLSEYMMRLRNRYNYIPVIIQQQSQETQSLEAFKFNKIRPSVAGLADSKYLAKDSNIMLGITNPYAHELKEYFGYDITKLKGSVRFLECVINRDGESNGIVALYFDGAVNFFTEMPPPDNVSAMEEVYRMIRERSIRQL